MLKQMKINLLLYGSIDTSNIDGNGEYVKKKERIFKTKTWKFSKKYRKRKTRKKTIAERIARLKFRWKN